MCYFVYPAFAMFDMGTCNIGPFLTVLRTCWENQIFLFKYTVGFLIIIKMTFLFFYWWKYQTFKSMIIELSDNCIFQKNGLHDIHVVRKGGSKFLPPFWMSVFCLSLYKDSKKRSRNTPTPFATAMYVNNVCFS